MVRVGTSVKGPEAEATNWGLSDVELDHMTHSVIT